MSATPATSLPARSDIEDWDSADLDDAATRWRPIADDSEQAFDEHRSNIVNTEWSGVAKDAVVEKVTAAVGVVGSQNQVIRNSAILAQNGSQDVQAARREALDAISAAEADGFRVGEDLSVRDIRRIDVSTMAARNTALHEHAEDIRWYAQQLVQTDTLIGNRLRANAAELDRIRFDGEGEGRDSTVRMLDDRQSRSEIDRDEQGADKPSMADPTPPAGPGAKPGEPGGPEFVIGPPTKPEFAWDEDFEYDLREPSFDDFKAAAEWQAKRNGAELVRPDLDDATAMYRHYWENNGKPQKFDFGEAYREDKSIKTAVDSEIARAAAAADQLVRSGHTNFSITGDAKPVGDQLYPDPKYPYPVTENWQKTIGSYQQWSHGDVRVEGNRVTMEITVEAEDHYNFNRGSADIASGAPDDANGRFTEVGWAKPFDTHGEITRTITWELGAPPGTQSGDAPPQFNPGREDRVDGRGSPGGLQWPDNNHATGTGKLR